MFKYKKCRKPNNGEAQIICRECRGEFHVPSTTTKYRCPRCKTINLSLGNGQSDKDSGNKMGLVKFSAAKNVMKSDDISQNARKSSYVMNQRPSSFSLIRSSFSFRRSNKRAVLCGVTYRKRRYRLKGTINDVANLRELLVKVFDFPIECIHELTEEQKCPDLVPTKKNILEQLKWLVEGCQPGDSLVFYFSGHGIQHTDSDEDEIDGMDESICPVDFQQEGSILDDDINSILVWPLKQGVTLHAIVDACHSGTILDLSHVYDPEKCIWRGNKPSSTEPSRKHPNGGRAICISACEDHQMAVDTSAFRGKGMNGVMTYLFTKVIRKYPDITYRGVMEQMGKEIEEIMRNSCLPSFFQHMFRPKFAQDLVISSSEEFDVSRTIFTL
ncbi:metacaspase-3-like isoform X2 [Neltuma alba]|uniref:metacaspase-3-like isoform X2 n=1 Tax=Neltuma alba TaxID=207710 RepID=UPI0010A3508B|nr:metacaspase-3-like isoform X2 [Prosopis alba]